MNFFLLVRLYTFNNWGKNKTTQLDTWIFLAVNEDAVECVWVKTETGVKHMAVRRLTVS